MTPAVHRQIRRGDAARDAREWAVAAQAYAAALEAEPGLRHIWIQRGHAHKEAGDLAPAAAAYAQAASLAPEAGEPHLHLGHVAKLRGDLAVAARHYLRAAQDMPCRAPAIAELGFLIARGTSMDMKKFADLIDAPAAPDAETQRELPVDDRSNRAGSTQCLVFDISDLVAYFAHARTPTGIQRVQLETLGQALLLPDQDVRICAFQEARDEWVELPRPLFLELAHRANGDDEDGWATCLARLTMRLALAEPFRFPVGAFLINLGTSWWLPNYFMYVRRAKEEAGIRYVPFVHDMIPLVRPDICPPPLVQDFTAWTVSVLEHADFYLANSQSTKNDLLQVANYLERPIDPDLVGVVRLDAVHRPVPDGAGRSGILARTGLSGSRFVLFVSTIEPRKNHILAFEAWARLIQRHGARQTPRLVCVGNPGWMNEPIHQFLEARPDLRARVTILSNLSEQDLAELYRNCLFSLYPSQYEGWGLPVTEALSHGKVPLCSRISSIPEAGGPFAEYFDLDSRAEFVEAVERLTFDNAHRRSRERAIAANFRPRSWEDIARQIAQSSAEWSRLPGRAEQEPPCVTLGRYYSFGRSAATAFWPGLQSSERFRLGFGWWGRDLWGCWSKPGGARLGFTLAASTKTHRIYLELLGMPNRASQVRIDANGIEGQFEARLGANERRWVSIDIAGHPQDSATVTIDLVCDTFEPLGETTDGGDTRLISVGLCGLFVCEADDVAARTALMEAVLLTSLDSVSINRPPASFVSLSSYLEGKQLRQPARPIPAESFGAPDLEPREGAPA